MTQDETSKSSRAAQKEAILQKATELFLQKGVRHVLMDDIATALSISKRTVYEIYQTKADLLFDVVSTREAAEEEHMHQFVEAHPDTIDIVVEFYRMNIKKLNEVNPIFFEDVHKYPDIIAFLRKKHEQHHQSSIDFIKRAVDEGYFRRDVNYDIFQCMGDASSQYFMNAQLYKRFPLQELFRTLLIVMLRGICTEKGAHAIDAHLKIFCGDNQKNDSE